jgi:hypothetical protein
MVSVLIQSNLQVPARDQRIDDLKCAVVISAYGDQLVLCERKMLTGCGTFNNHQASHCHAPVQLTCE